MPANPENQPPEPLLEARNLAVGFEGPRGFHLAVEGIDFTLNARETLCLVGESGCGKSVASLSLLRLLPSPPARVVSGNAWLYPAAGRGSSGPGGPGGPGETGGAGRTGETGVDAPVDLLALSEKELEKVRGASVGMVFQDPMTALNPVLRIGDQVAEGLLLHGLCSRSEAKQRAIDLLGRVGIPNPAERYRAFPHQLSGGMRQRVMIASALICRPRVLIADEPTTALDASLQGQILGLMQELVASLSGALLLITHDLDLVARHGQRVAVMYAGRVVEYGPAAVVLQNPLHPYTEGLLRSRPRLDLDSRNSRDARDAGAARARRLPAIPGVVPPPWGRPPGCAFSNRCPKVFTPCRESMPPLTEREAGRFCRCYL